MRETADVVVVGGGVTGASIAFHLAEAGVRDVVVLESGRLGSGSTGRAMGGMRAQFADPLHIRMSLFSMALFEAFADVTGGSCGYLPHGYLLLATTPEHLTGLADAARIQRAAGLSDVEALTADEVARRLPFLECSDVMGAAFRERDGFIDPIGLLNGFADAAMRAGCRFVESARVTAVRTAGGTVVGVDTADRAFDAPVVVNAAGAWSAAVAGLAGIELPVQPLRRQLARTRPVPDVPAAMPMVIDLTNGFHFRPDPRGSGPPGLRIAGPDARPVQDFETSFDREFLHPAISWATRRAPRLGPLTPDEPRCSAGLYAVSPDHHAILGEEAELRGFYEANGFSGHGVMHSPATGRILAELITSGRSETFPEASCLGPARLRDGTLLTEPAVF